MSLVADLKMGLASEENIKGLLEKKFDERLEKTDHYHPMDYVSSKCWIEIKTRRFACNTYKTTILPYSKIEFALSSALPVYFVFVFTDGIFYIPFDAATFALFNVSEFARTDRTDTIDYVKDYIYIPVERLVKIL